MDLSVKCTIWLMPTQTRCGDFTSTSRYDRRCQGASGKMQVGDNGVEPLNLPLKLAKQAETPVMCHIGAGVPLPDICDCYVRAM